MHVRSSPIAAQLERQAPDASGLQSASGTQTPPQTAGQTAPSVQPGGGPQSPSRGEQWAPAPHSTSPTQRFGAPVPSQPRSTSMREPLGVVPAGCIGQLHGAPP